MDTYGDFGFGVPLVTPTDDKGEVDPSSTRKLWDHMFPLVDVPVVLGTTGRGRFILNQDLSQAKRLVDLGIELARRHGKPLVVGTGAETLERAMDLTAYAGSCNVYAVLVTAPIHASSPFAQSLARSPMASEYQERLAEEYFREILRAIPTGSSTIFLPYIFPTLTGLRPKDLSAARDTREAPAGGRRVGAPNRTEASSRSAMIPFRWSTPSGVQSFHSWLVWTRRSSFSSQIPS